MPGIVGLGAACRLAQEEMIAEAARIAALRDRFETLLGERVPGVRFNGCRKARLPGNSSVTFPGVPADALLAHLPHIALSAGPACESGALEPSHVLLAIGLSREQALSTVRAGLGRFTTEAEIETAAASLAEAWARIAAL